MVSSGRAGTTLLCSMLNASDQVFFPPESDFLSRAYPYSKLSTPSDRVYHELTELFARSSQLHGWGIKETIRSTLLQERPQSFAEINDSIYRTALNHMGAGKARWGIKAPVLIASVSKIWRVFPAAKIVHVVRDGRDVFLSYRKVNEGPRGFGPKGVSTCALYWVDGLRRIPQRDDRIFELRYEDLLKDPENVLKQLCGFLGIEYRPSMQSGYESSAANRHLILERHKETIHHKVSEGLDVSNQGKYVTLMTRAQRYIFELLTAPFLARYGYPIEHPSAARVWFAPIRALFYVNARIFNDCRYWWRSRRTVRIVRRRGRNSKRSL